MNWPTDWTAIKTYLQFFAGVVCVGLAVGAESMAAAVGPLVGAYLLLRAAFA